MILRQRPTTIFQNGDYSTFTNPVYGVVAKLDPHTHRMPAEKILEYLKIWALYNIVQCPCFRSKPKLQVINTILFLRHSPYKCWIKAKGIVRKYLSVRLCYDASG